MLSVPEAARRAGKNPETVRRWIREGKVVSTRVGTQHFIEEEDLLAMTNDSTTAAELPEEWRRTAWGDPMPDVVAAIRRSRQGH
jgi:excisionase family DNA binding protein